MQGASQSDGGMREAANELRQGCKHPLWSSTSGIVTSQSPSQGTGALWQVHESWTWAGRHSSRSRGRQGVCPRESHAHQTLEQPK